MSTLTASIAQHDSKPAHYIHPFLFTCDSKSATVYIWICKGSEPALSTTLENVTEAWEYHLVTPNRLLTRIAPGPDYDSSELLVHEIPSGNLLDRLFLASQGSLLGVANGNIAVWKKNTQESGNGSVEIYDLSAEGKFTLSNTLQSPPEIPHIPKLQIRPDGYLSSKLIHLTREELVEISIHSDFPTSVHLTRWSSNPSRTKNLAFDFQDVNPLPSGTTKSSSLQDYVVIPSSNSIVMANYEHRLDMTETNLTTVLRSIDIDDLKVNWVTSLPQKTYALRYVPNHSAILAIGSVMVKERADGTPSEEGSSRLTITILDSFTGSVKGSHIVRQPQYPCGNVSRSEAGIQVDITASGSELVIVFGDGQLAVIALEQFVRDGFETLINEEGKIITRPFPKTSISEPKNAKQRKEKAKGVWSWVRRAFFGDEQVILEANEAMGFLTLSWK